MAPTNLNRKRTYAQLVRARPVAPVRPVVHARPVVHRWFKYFDDVEFDDCRINRVFSVIVKVDVKFHPKAYCDIQRFILMDATTLLV
uniref:Uncharacterized protein n=1 Tax=Oryza punctata TaxID=4537 RepID=A0A0E0LWJ7_ORYPU